MGERLSHDRLLRLGLVILLVALGAVSLDRAWRGRYDFHHFYLDACYVWEHGELNPGVTWAASEEGRQLPFYLPVVPLILSPIAALGRSGAALVWAAAQVLALGYSLRVLGRWAAYSGSRAPAVLGVATLLALPALVEAAKFNQLSYFVLALVLGGLDALDRQKPKTAGAIFAGAAVLKLLPGIFLPWLLLKRQWSAAAALVVVGVVLALVPPLVAFGPQVTLAYHRQWWSHNLRGDSAEGLLDPALPAHFIDRRNQSVFQVLARLTWPEHPFRAPRQPLRLDRQTCVSVACGLDGLLLAALLAATRRPWRAVSVWRRHAEAAVFAIGMLVFSPLLRQYYLVWVLPALVLLAQAAARDDLPRVRRFGWGGLGVWAAGMLAWIWPLSRLLGAHLAMLIAMGILLLWATRRNALQGEAKQPIDLGAGRP